MLHNREGLASPRQGVSRTMDMLTFGPVELNQTVFHHRDKP